ncbi:MAG: NADH-quinone oxidoreductase subunit H [Actinobacteria bacterium]|nr:NADH-quinone oxidoreductase subunit H [Actinomycetota bacterium]
MSVTPAWAAVAGVAGAVGAGVYIAAVADRAVGATVAGERGRAGRALGGPFRAAALWLVQGRATTERPDARAWALAPALYLGLAAVAVSVVPLTRNVTAVDVDAGLVLFGAAQALAVIPVFPNGWSSNSMLPLIGAFRFIAEALSYEMPNLLALLSVSVPASSLALGDIVTSQHHLWNVVRIPLGLPLFLFAGAGLAFWGPVDLPDGADLGGGTQAETSGAHLLAWTTGRLAMLFAISAMGAAAFLGGWLGPVLPGAAWMIVKTVALLVVLVSSRHLVARVRPERYVVISWAVLIPLALVNVIVAAAVSL